MLEEKFKGMRKAGIAIGTITGVLTKPPEDIRVTAGILLLAGLAIVCQTLLDLYKIRKAKQETSE